MDHSESGGEASGPAVRFALGEHAHGPNDPDRMLEACVHALGRQVYRFLPCRATAYVDYFLRPSVGDKWGGPFNGQIGRVLMFRELNVRLGFSHAVETGTFRGATTEHLARAIDGRVYSVEKDCRYYHYARLRLRGHDNVVLEHGDSRTFLRNEVRSLAAGSGHGFFYLDAHWGEDWPLAEELEIVLADHPDAVVMVDDLPVPGAEGYGYDEYGGSVPEVTGRSLAALAPEHALFLPAVDPDAETGSRKGCAVLVPADVSDEVESGVATLSRWGR